MRPAVLPSRRLAIRALLVNGVNIAGHRGALAGSSNQVEFYPDLGYVLVVLGNTDSGTDAIAAHVPC